MSILIIIILLYFIYSARSELKEEKNENKRLKKQISIMKEFIKKYIPDGEMSLEEKMMFKENEFGNSIMTSQEKIAKLEKAKISTDEAKKVIPNNVYSEKEIMQNNVYAEKGTKEILQNNSSLAKENRKVNTCTSKKVNEEDSRNVAILITGAVLIVLSAIVFLMTTWYTIPNILKTVVLVCLIAVFLGASKIAKNKFKLEKASLTFFFIAMAYIPICLFSISIFELLGEYLSIYGEGRFIYFTISSILVSIIYYCYYKSTKNKILLYGSVLAQELTIILFTCVLKVDFNIIIINLSLYNIILTILTSELKEKVFIDIYKTAPFVLVVLNLFNFDIVDELLEIRLLILAINFLILELKYTSSIYSYMVNILYIIASTVFINNIEMFSSLTREILILLNIIVTYFIENLIIMGRKKENLQNASLITSLVTIMIFHVEFVEIKPYIVSIIVILFALMVYKKTEETGKTMTGIIIPIYFIMSGVMFFKDLELSYHYQVIFSIICFILGEFITGKNSDILKKTCFVVSHIFIAITYISCFVEYTEFSNDIFYYFILMIVYVYSFFKYQKFRIFKYLAYLTSNLVLVSGCEFFDITSEEILKVIPMITTIGIMMLEKRYKSTELKDDFSRAYISIFKIISFVLISDMGNVGVVLSIAFAGFSIYNNITEKENQLFDLIPLFGILPSITEHEMDENIRLLLFVGITIATTALSIYKAKFSVYTVFSFIYLIYLTDYINNIYCSQILVILWSLLHCIFEKNNKVKDTYKAIVYIVTTSLYYEIIENIKLDEYTLFNSLGIFVLTILIFKNIIRKYIKQKDIEPIEYIVYGIIYLCMITSYTSLSDAMLFLSLIIGMVIYSYLKKYGTLFIVSIIALLVNVFYLTKEFWLAIPWWLYLLVIGSILITFAIRNEAKENKEKLSLEGIINKIKDNIEK